MKILYAVQATGNGHITRARIMARAFQQLGVEVDWIFSGRPKEELFDMQIFGDYRVYSGLTFVIENGGIQYVKTAFKNNIFKFIRDLFRIDFTGYDRIINDYEPVTAWAAKIRGIKTIGISHQMAFHKDIPMAGKNSLAHWLLKNFAPVNTPVGLHWDHFQQHLLPPVIESPSNNFASGQADLSCNKIYKSDKNILVYFPFCEPQKLIDWFAPYSDYQFHIFHGCDDATGHPHIHLHHFSRENFQAMQAMCSGVITGAGFELPSEAMQLGQKLFILPLENQMEQQSNALALEKINRATIAHHFSHRKLKSWLQQPRPNAVIFPNVAYAVAKWIVTFESESLASLSKNLWQQIQQSTVEKSPVGPQSEHTLPSSVKYV